MIFGRCKLHTTRSAGPAKWYNSPGLSPGCWVATYVWLDQGDILTPQVRDGVPSRVIVAYRVFQKTDPLVYFDNNFGKYGPILTVFSLLQQEIHDTEKLSYFCHLTFIMLPLYLAKQTLMLVSMRIFLDHAANQISMYSNG